MKDWVFVIGWIWLCAFIADRITLSIPYAVAAGLTALGVFIALLVKAY